MSDSNKDLYGEREILNNYIELKRNFIGWERRYVIVAEWGYFVRSFEVLTLGSSANYASAMCLAIQTLYIS